MKKRFTVGCIATGLYGISPTIVGETCIIVTLADGNFVQHYGVNEKGEVFTASPTPDGFQYNSLPVNPGKWEFIGRRAIDWPDEVSPAECREVAKKFRRQAEEDLRKGGYGRLKNAQNGRNPWVVFR